MWLMPPDPDSDWEMWLALAFFNIVANIRSPWAVALLIGAGLLIAGYVLARLLWLSMTRLFAVYRWQALTSSPRAPLLKATLGVVLVVWLVAGWLVHDDQQYGVGLDLLALGFLLLVVVGELVEWYEQRLVGRQQVAVPAEISLAEVISWRKEVHAAHRDGSPDA